MTLRGLVCRTWRQNPVRLRARPCGIPARVWNRQKKSDLRVFFLADAGKIAYFILMYVRQKKPCMMTASDRALSGVFDIIKEGLGVQELCYNNY